MTAEERWRQALEDEERDPSDWAPDTERLHNALVDRLQSRGCLWPELAVRVLEARSHTALDRSEFAARMGLSEHALRALEGFVT